MSHIRCRPNPLFVSGLLVLAAAIFPRQSLAQSQPSKSDLRSMLSYVSTVKSQQGRNTCTVFALTANLESLYMKFHGDSDIDFSEEWIQYLAAGATASGGAKGSTVSINFDQVKKHGVTTETLMPFTAQAWTDKDDDPNASKVTRFCGHLRGMEFTRCLFGKRSPRYLCMSDNQLKDLPGGQQFSQARQKAEDFRGFTHSLRIGVVNSPNKIKAFLNAQVPLTLELNVHYGSWNHSAGTNFGIDVDQSLFSKGIVTYPERGSVDLVESNKNPARHAVQVIGYDDDIEITYEKLMSDGSKRTFTRKGVYFVKNSWGKKFGKNFRLGRSRIPGLGMITQDYAHDMGKFSVVKISQ